MIGYKEELIMETDIVVVFLTLIGLGTVTYWIMKFCIWFVDKLIKKSDEKGNRDLIIELEKIKAEIREWYWQTDKQKISKDPCVVDAMTDLFIRTVDNHIKELKGE